MELLTDSVGMLQKVNFAKGIARSMLKEQSKYLEKRLGDHVDSSLTIAGDLLLQTIKPMFEEITEKGIESSRVKWMKMIDEKLEKHPLFMNKDKYSEAINITREELKLLLGQISYDPSGEYGFSALISSSITGLCSIICAIIVCRWGNTHRQMANMRSEIRDTREERKALRHRET